MKLTKSSNKNWFYNILSFAVPFIGMLIVMMVAECSPFGRYSMLYSDMYHQYFPFFKAFRQALLSSDSLLYNWDVGLGLDYLGLYSYYLASPLNLLSVLVPEGWVLGYFSDIREAPRVFPPEILTDAQTEFCRTSYAVRHGK